VASIFILKASPENQLVLLYKMDIEIREMACLISFANIFKIKCQQLTQHCQNAGRRRNFSSSNVAGAVWGWTIFI